MSALDALAQHQRDDVRTLARVAVEARALLVALGGDAPGGDLATALRAGDVAYSALLDDARHELAHCDVTDVRRALDRRVRTIDAAASQWHVAMRALVERLRLLAEAGVSL